MESLGECNRRGIGLESPRNLKNSVYLFNEVNGEPRPLRDGIVLSLLEITCSIRHKKN